MDLKEKELLLQDLCSRLPYGVHCCVLNLNKTIKEDNDIIYGIVGDNIVTLKSNKNECYMYYQIKPYLRPMSSMTKEEENECIGFPRTITIPHVRNWFEFLITNHIFTDWLNAHHFDYRGLIERGLALEAPVGMYKIKEK